MTRFFDTIYYVKGCDNTNARLRILRKALKLSQESFGKQLGITGAGVSKLESGDRNLTQQTILLICQQFNVRKQWLETGEGEMFDQAGGDDLFAQFVRQHRLSETSAAIMRSYVELPPEDRENLHRIVVRLLASSLGAPVSTGDPYQDATIDKLRSDPEFQRALAESVSPSTKTSEK